jgi:hypothetical protein
MRSEVFADSDCLLGRGLVEGNSLRPVVALQLCLVVLFVGWADGRWDLALGREAVHVSLSGDEVPALCCAQSVDCRRPQWRLTDLVSSCTGTVCEWLPRTY